MFNTLDNSSDNLVLLEFNITDDYQKFESLKAQQVHELVVPLIEVTK